MEELLMEDFTSSDGLNLGDVYEADGKKYKVSLPDFDGNCAGCDLLGKDNLCIPSPSCMNELRVDKIDIVYKLINDREREE
jgi:hypothetical protein